MKTMYRLAAMALLSIGTSMAQTPSTPAPPPPPVGCDSVESKQFDFWVGNWSFTSSSGSGTNRVGKILDGCVVWENFEGAPLKGQSFSTFDRATKKWKQTWVDNTASYLDFTGGIVDGKMILSREFEQAGKRIGQRMVWFDIHADHFQWNWERSDDRGQTWKVLWHIDYKRVK